MQSLHTNSYDETYALPTEEAATLALRTQQIIAHESGVPNVVDPLGGSYFLETLTDQMEAEANRYLEKIDALGGIARAIEEGYPAAGDRRRRLPLPTRGGCERAGRGRGEQARVRGRARHTDAEDRPSGRSRTRSPAC